MCGIVGFIDLSLQYKPSELKSIIIKMSDTLIHRGPDDSGIWIDEKSGIALGHRRLAIIDLSSTGHQPMESHSGRYVIVFNGEIYNYPEIRKSLQRVSNRNILWRGYSDTETLLAAIDQWGVKETLKMSIGMFAFALWDKQERVLYLVRDRIGEKPLYYGLINNTFLFASELKALCAYPNWQGETNRDAIALFLRHSYIPAPYSIYKGIYKVLPGTAIKVFLNNKNIISESYWSAREVAESGISYPFIGSESDAIAQLESLLRDAISKQMIADVPLGAFLSGGIDSSTVVALMQAQSNKSVKTFTIGFNESGYNEAEHANAIAKHLGTEHTELYITPKEAMDVIPKLPALYDEPFSDSSQIPTFIVASMTRNYVTVALSGDGGDELFGGYNRYFYGRKIWRIIKNIPFSFRYLLKKIITSISPQRLDKLVESLSFIMPIELIAGRAGDKLHKLSEVIDKKSTDEVYNELISHWKTPSSIVLNATEPLTVITDRSQWANLDDFTLTMMYLDMVSYLPDDIMVKVDRAAMGVSLETRAPFLDHRVVEFAWELPLSFKIRNRQGKWILRQVLYRYVPEKLVNRPKMGFGVPIDTWLRGPLKDWAEDLLDEKRLQSEGLFNPEPIRKKWSEHLSGRRNWQYHLWDVLMFQAWLHENSKWSNH